MTSRSCHAAHQPADTERSADIDLWLQDHPKPAQCHAAGKFAVIECALVSSIAGRCHAARQPAGLDLRLQAQPEFAR